MRTLWNLGALVLGVLIVGRGLNEGLPAPPLAAGAWGTLLAFGFGALLALVGLRYLVLLLRGDEEPLGSGMTVVLMVVATGLTAGAVAWKGTRKVDECAVMLRHAEALYAVRDGAEAARARVEAVGPQFMAQCARTPAGRRRCPMQATTVEEFAACP